MTITETLKGILTRNSGLSSLRVNQFLVLLSVLPLGPIMCWAIIYQAIYRVGGVQWGDMAIFLGALAAFYTGFFGMKALNASQENKRQNPTPDEHINQ